VELHPSLVPDVTAYPSSFASIISGRRLRPKSTILLGAAVPIIALSAGAAALRIHARLRGDVARAQPIDARQRRDAVAR
jgi:hypothetical protein